MSKILERGVFKNSVYYKGEIDYQNKLDNCKSFVKDGYYNLENVFKESKKKN